MGEKIVGELERSFERALIGARRRGIQEGAVYGIILATILVALGAFILHTIQLLTR